MFNSYFSDYISRGTKQLPIETLSRWVDEKDLFKYLDSIGIDPMLQHEQLRELVALKALQESYYNDVLQTPVHYSAYAVVHRLAKTISCPA